MAKSMKASHPGHDGGADGKHDGKKHGGKHHGGKHHEGKHHGGKK
jgi:hypothetical protein